MRQVYAEEAKPLAETYLNPDRPQDSVYVREHSKLLGPQHYKDPTQKVVQKEPPPGFGHHGCAHWKSTSHSMHDPASIAGAAYHRQAGPSYQADNPPTCVSQPIPHSMCGLYHGKHGHDPRFLHHPSWTSLEPFRNELTAGTHKGTNHIPGYSGFLAQNTTNPHVARVVQGASLRKIDKTNLTEQFHVNLLGYSGHQPVNPQNDRGGVKPNTITNMGRSFTVPNLRAFA